MPATRIGIILVIVAVLVAGGFLYNQKNAGDQVNNDTNAVPASDVHSDDVDEMMVNDGDAMMEEETMMDEGGETMMEDDGTIDGGAAMILIRYTDSGFEPKETIINAGDIVTFRNDGSRSMWPASAQHPTHMVYPGSGIEKCNTSEQSSIFDACRVVESYSFTFNEVGTWFYHNHVLASHFGSIVVK